jgi:hypothetical protein
VLEQAGRWAAQQISDHPDLVAVGVFGSYCRGTAGVGSDLDLLLILQRCDEPIWNRLRRWDTSSLPLACDLLVYSLEEWRSLPQWNPKLAEALLNDTRWLGEMPGRRRNRRADCDQAGTYHPQSAPGAWPDSAGLHGPRPEPADRHR